MVSQKPLTNLNLILKPSINLLVYLLIITKITTAEEIVSDESKDQNAERMDDKYLRVPNNNRRNMENVTTGTTEASSTTQVTDTGTDTVTDSECPSDTVEDSMKKALKNDPGFMKFVSGHALPVDESEILKSNTCKNKKVNGTKAPLKTTKEVEQATTVSHGKIMKHKHPDVNNSRRDEGDQYQYSSIEYYDEPGFLDPAACPDVLEIIDLQIEHLKPYDVECGLLLLWQSLE